MCSQCRGWPRESPQTAMPVRCLFFLGVEGLAEGNDPGFCRPRAASPANCRDHAWRVRRQRCHRPSLTGHAGRLSRFSRVSVKKSMTKDKEQEDGHVTFEHPFPAHMMAIDGTWRRSCSLKEVSETSATLQVDGSIEGLALKEFFLLLSTVGRVPIVEVSLRA